MTQLDAPPEPPAQPVHRPPRSGRIAVWLALAAFGVALLWAAYGASMG